MYSLTDLFIVFVDRGIKHIQSFKYGESLWGVTGKIVVHFNDDSFEDYFYKASNQQRLCSILG